MPHLSELEKSYAAMNEFGQNLLLEVAAGFVVDFPAPKKAASLLLVANGARVEPRPNNTDHSVDRFPLVVVRQPVDR